MCTAEAESINNTLESMLKYKEEERIWFDPTTILRVSSVIRCPWDSWAYRKIIPKGSRLAKNSFKLQNKCGKMAKCTQIAATPKINGVRTPEGHILMNTRWIGSEFAKILQGCN